MTACPRCGHPALAGARFCSACGTPLVAPPDPARFGSPGRLHARPSRRAHPRLARGAGRRAQAGHRALRRHAGLDGAARGPRSRGGGPYPRPGPRADDGGRAPLRGHREPGDGRRDHGAVRRAARPRGPRGAGRLRRPPDARAHRRLRRPHAARGGGAAADPRGHQLGRGDGALDRERPLHVLYRGGPDRAPRRAHGADGQARLHPRHRGDGGPGRGPRGRRARWASSRCAASMPRWRCTR